MSKEKKSKREAKLARRAEKKARWESLIADLDHAKKENARLGFVLEKLRSVMALPTCASSEILHDIDSILNAEPDEEVSSEVKRVQEEEDEEDRLEKIVESWDNEELVRVFWEFVNDQGIESDFIEYSRNVARTRDK